MQRKRTRRSEGAWYGDVSRLEPAVIRVVAVAASVITVALALLYAATQHPTLGKEAISAAVIAVTAFGIGATRRRSALLLFMIIAAIVVVTVKVIADPETQGGATVALVVIGMTGSAFVPHRAAPAYIASYTAIIVGGHLYWTDSWVRGIADGAITTAVFISGAMVFSWLRHQSGVDAERYRSLFDRAPVSIWEEDFTGVAALLDELRSRGVTDLAAFLAEHPDAIREAASRIEVLAVNDAAVELLEADGVPQLQGRLNPETLTDEALCSIVRQLQAVWDGEDHLVIEVSGGRTMKGRPLDAILSWTVPRIGDRRDLSRVLVSIVDVTEIRRTQAQLERLLRSKDEFVASVSHELRTPLTAVVGLALELRDSFEGLADPETREIVDLIASQGEEVSTIVDDLLAAARATLGTLEVGASPVDLVAEAVGVLRGMGVEQEVPIVTAERLPMAAADAGRFRQIVRNLLVNAQRYGGAQIRIVVATQDEAVILEVRDSGPPLPPEERDAIFDRYYRAQQVPGVTASVGLGLSLSRELARRMGGDLVYDHDGTEAIFRLALPETASVAV
jgi:signal transduction histidine kinase